ncbi:LLM class flavin-dependent oxidoreductase [Georgenia sp. 10Sc9-8]|uniref:LLM class flavin-dependent oxidoreductase n=1 Tax=Georgenia halotolerans TaxID=3028317 RepID=A0ABT5TYA2_9MICO|nr:LLM class flavin-dependent oxidoreductase [Georgenia halotolerans]
MDHGHPLQLGLALPADADPATTLSLARRAEELGLDLLTLTEHDLDGWTQLSWLAAGTERIGVSATLTPGGRPPTVLARAVASLDLLAHGRVSITLAAQGASARPADDDGARPTHDDATTHDAAALAEAIEIVRGMWAAEPGPLVRDGEHYRVPGAERGPAPAHTVPIWITGDDAALLDLAGTAADGWLAPAGTDLAAAHAGIDAAAVAADRDPREIRRAVTVSRRGPTGELLDGSPDQWVNQLLPLVLGHGVGTILLEAPDPETLDHFAGQVAPALRDAVATERTRRGTALGTVRPSWVRARRRPGIDYDAVPAALQDRAVEPGDARYGTVRSGYMRGGSPGLVLPVRDAQQVAEALAFARTQEVPLSVRSGGHGISGRSTNDGGIIIDLAPMDRIEVLDVATRRVRVEAGARWGQVAAALQPHGWALSSGDFGGVGVGGLATAGGIGFLGRKHGLTIDHVRAVDVVLADGTQVRASETENAELFWGVRGAGFALGVVTAFEFEVDEVGDVGFAQLVFDAGDTAGFLQRWGSAVEAAPRDLTSFLIMGAPRGGQLVAQTMTVIDSADPDVILQQLQPFAALGPLLQQQVVITPYAGVVSPPAGAYYGQSEPVTRNGLLEHVTPHLAADAARLVRSGESFFFQIRAMGGAITDVDPDATAFAHRSANFHVSAMGADRAGLDRAWDAMHHHFDGLYVSFETDRRPERLTDAYPPRTLRRLRELKRRYDPDNVFRDNMVIPPAD